MDGEGLTKLKTGRKQTGHLYYIQMKLYPGQKKQKVENVFVQAQAKKIGRLQEDLGNCQQLL